MVNITRNQSPFALLLGLCLMFVLSACASGNTPIPLDANAVKATQEQKPQEKTSSGISSLDDDDLYLEQENVVSVISDPLEPWNRFWFNFNDAFIGYVAKPINTGYVTIMPAPARTGISNFFHNLMFPQRFVNNLLQGKVKVAGAELYSFMADTTIGIGGLINISEDFRKKYIPDDEDTGQTLGLWGVGEGIYLTWPFLGPSNLRDSVGSVGDYFLDPTSYLEPWELSLAVTVTRTVNDLDDTISMYEEFKDIAVEPYSAVRDGYTQYRRAKIAQ